MSTVPFRWVNNFDPLLQAPIGRLLTMGLDPYGNHCELREISLFNGQRVHVNFSLVPLQHIFIPAVHAPVEMPRMVNYPSAAPSLPFDFAAHSAGSSQDAEVIQPDLARVDSIEALAQSEPQPAKQPTEAIPNNTVNEVRPISEPCCSTDVDMPVSPPSTSKKTEIDSFTKGGKSKRQRQRNRKPKPGNNISQKSVPDSSTSTHIPLVESSTSQLYSLSEVGHSNCGGSLTPNRLPSAYFEPLRAQPNKQLSKKEVAFSRYLSRVATGKATVQREDYQQYGQDYSRVHNLPESILNNLQKYNLIISETNIVKTVKKKGREQRKTEKAFTIKIPLRVNFKNGILYRHPESQYVMTCNKAEKAVFEIGIAKNGTPFHTFLRIFDDKPQRYIKNHLNDSERVEFERIINSTNTEVHKLMYDFVNGDEFTVFLKSETK